MRWGRDREWLTTLFSWQFFKKYLWFEARVTSFLWFNLFNRYISILLENSNSELFLFTETFKHVQIFWNIKNNLLQNCFLLIAIFFIDSNFIIFKFYNNHLLSRTKLKKKLNTKRQSTGLCFSSFCWLGLYIARLHKIKYYKQWNVTWCFAKQNRKNNSRESKISNCKLEHSNLTASYWKFDSLLKLDISF